MSAAEPLDNLGRFGKYQVMEETRLTPAQAAAILRVSASTIRRLDTAGTLPGERTPGGHRRYDLADVESLARQLAAGKDVA